MAVMQEYEGNSLEESNGEVVVDVEIEGSVRMI